MKNHSWDELKILVGVAYISIFVYWQINTSCLLMESKFTLMIQSSKRLILLSMAYSKNICIVSLYFLLV